TKLKILILLAVCGLALPLRAALFTENLCSGMVIPDGGGAVNTLSRTISVTGLGNQLTDINVILNVSGGWNGDLHAYLRGPNGSIAILLNRVGRTSVNPDGYSTMGFN